MNESDRLRIHNLLTEALVERGKWDNKIGTDEDTAGYGGDALDMYHYYDGKVSGLREAAGLPIEEPV